MHTSMRIRLGLVLALAVGVAGCEGPCSRISTVTGPAFSAGTVDFSTYVSAGTSISAGWQSGGLVDRHQIHSFPTLFARQIGKTVQADGRGDFTLPVYDRDGFPQLLHIVSYSPLIITPTGRTTGNPTNTAQATAYHNMAVPFAIAFDFVDSSFYYNAAVHPAVAIPLFDNIVRHRGTVAQNALSLAPTFMTWEYGSNEVLGPTSVGAAASTNTAAQYAPVVAGSLNAIHALLPNTRVAVFNVPDVTSVPFVTTLSPFTVNATTGAPLPLVGASGPLQQGDFVLLTASTTIATTGTGIPAGGINYLNPSVPSNGQPLPENFILRAAEAAQTRTEVGLMNAALAAEVAARPYVALVDLNGILNTIAANGLRIGGNLYTTDFITGGLFSLDGVHPNDLAHAVICNALIDAVNARFAAGIPHLNVLDWATPSSSAVQPAFPGEGRALPVRIDGLEERLPGPGPFPTWVP